MPSALSRLGALRRGTKLVLAAGGLLFVDLFLTWQKLELDFGDSVVTASLDGWDAWGVLIGLITLVLLAVVAFREVERENLYEGPWEQLALLLGCLVLLLVLVKNATDAESAWASYLGVVLAVGIALGAYLDWSDARAEADADAVVLPYLVRPPGSEPLDDDVAQVRDAPRQRW